MDSFQLEPIGVDPKIFDWEKSEFYTEHFLEHNRYELTEVKRYDGSLLKIATELRTTKKAEFILPEDSDLNPVTKFSRQLGIDIMENNSFAILTATNDKRISYNRMVRIFKYKKDYQEVSDLPNTILKGERLISISNSNFYSNGEILNPDIQRLTSLGKVFIEEYEQGVKIPKQKNNGQLQMAIGDERFKPKPIKINEFELFKVRTLNNNFDQLFDGGSGYHDEYFLFSHDIKQPSFHGQSIVKAHNEGRLKTTDSNRKKLIFRANNGIEYFNKNVSIVTYGYALSTHKAQGNEWDNIYVDAPFLMQVWNHARWFYTAITRAKKSVEILPTAFIRIKKPNGMD